MLLDVLACEISMQTNPALSYMDLVVKHRVDELDAFETQVLHFLV